MDMIQARSKADRLKAYRERCKDLVRKGEMSIEAYLTKVCGVSEAKVPLMRDQVLASL